MTKEELIQLLKEYKENVAKLKLRKKEKNKYEKILYKKFTIETKITSNMGINAEIHSKNNISDKVGNEVVDSIVKYEEDRKKAEIKLNKLNEDILALEEKIEEAEIRLNSLYYKEREILIAYYVENRTSEDISQNLYFQLFNRTCSPRYIRKLIDITTENLLKL